MQGYIAVEGNIAAGKTTLSQVLSRMLGFPVLSEPHEYNEFLPKMYMNPPRWAFSTQVSFLYLRSQDFFQMLQTRKIFIVDRTLFSDRYVFAETLTEQGAMTSEEFRMYKRWAEWFEEKFWGPPLLVIYVKCPVEELLRRIKLRGREMEKVITTEYLEGLERKHEEMIRQWKKKGVYVLDVDSGKIDFTKTYCPELEEIVKQIRETLKLQEPVIELLRFDTLPYTRPLFIAVEGNIAAGKTTFASHLSDVLNARLVSEQWERNPFLKLQYQDPTRWAFSSQMKFLLLRAQMTEQALQENPNVVVFDRTYLSERYAFGEVLHEQGFVHPEEYELYKQFFNFIIPKCWPRIDAIIYVRADVSVLMERIRLRSRLIEHGLSEEYIEKLQEKLDHLFVEDRYELGLPVIKINSGRIDFRDKAEVIGVVKRLPLPARLIEQT
jgi:deoxyadenosine/deoxycytidine kinase